MKSKNCAKRLKKTRQFSWDLRPPAPAAALKLRRHLRYPKLQKFQRTCLRSLVLRQLYNHHQYLPHLSRYRLLRHNQLQYNLCLSRRLFNNPSAW